MRTMVVVVLAAVMALVTAGNVQAKSTTDTQPAPKVHKVNKVLKNLHLTDKQNAEVKMITAQAKKEAAQAKSKSEKAEIRRAAVDKIRTTVLTEDQRKQFDEQITKVKQAKAEKASAHAKPTKA